VKVEVYGKKQCTQCINIKADLDALGCSYTYCENEATLNGKALELREKGVLIEMIAPIVVVNGIQVKHRNIKHTLGGE